MFCPQCATPNAGDVKFCRSCGAELAASSALSGTSASPAEAGAGGGEPKTARDWMERRIEAAGVITRGAILLSVSLLIGVAMALFIPWTFRAAWMMLWWMLLWMVFFGWMAVWGGIQLAYGVSGMLEAKGRLRLLGLTGRETTVEALPQQQLTGGEPITITNRSGAARPSPPSSVTEGTTRNLEDYVEK